LTRKSNTKEFISKAIDIHGDKYDYSKVVYVKAIDKVKIVCSVHGEFLQIPASHLSGCGCTQCYYDSKLDTLETFIGKATERHKGYYSYNKSIYVSAETPIIITCPIHGDFSQTPHGHTRQSANGCKECANDSMRSNTKEFIEKSTLVHNSLYSYERAEYIDSHTPIVVTCRHHGDVEVVDTYSSNLLTSIYLEEELHKLFFDKRYKGAKFNGYTECFHLSEDDLEFLELFFIETTEDNFLFKEVA